MPPMRGATVMERRDFVGALLAVFCGVAVLPERRAVIYAVRLRDRDPWVPLPEPLTVSARFIYENGRIKWVDLDGIHEAPALLLEGARTNYLQLIELDGARW